MNPLLPRSFFMADAEAHVLPDGRLYIVGSTDISGCRDYCGPWYHIWSTDDPELRTWVDHGQIFSNEAGSPGIPWAPGTPLYAPDLAYKDGRYYLYICGANNFEAVASADSPAGPYGDVKRIEGADGDSIDPTVFVDDDGTAYYLWGQFHLRGAKLKDNMYELDRASLTDNILTEQEHGFHEGASLRKINGRYYIVFTDISRGRATCMSYAVADHPLGPYKKGGVIVDNTYCDPKSWNDHGSIQYYKGRWFVFYHRSTQNGVTCRRVCAEPLTVLPDGSIPEVPMTTNGAEPPLSAFGVIDAACASRMKGDLYITPCEAGEIRAGDDAGDNAGYNAGDDAGDNAYVSVREKLTDCGGGNWTDAWAEYRSLDFGDGAGRFFVTASGKGSIILMAEGLGQVARAELSPGAAAAPQTVSVKTDVVIRGVKAVWLLFRGSGIDTYSFGFEP